MSRALLTLAALGLALAAAGCAGKAYQNDCDPFTTSDRNVLHSHVCAGHEAATEPATAGDPVDDGPANMGDSGDDEQTSGNGNNGFGNGGDDGVPGNSGLTDEGR